MKKTLNINEIKECTGLGRWKNHHRDQERDGK